MSNRVTRGRAFLLLAGVVAVLAAASSAIAGAPQERPQFGTTVEIVQMQVQVADARGRHIPRLEADDFALRVDGEARDLVALYEVDLSPGSEQPEDAYVSPAGWRQFLLFFDFSFSTKAGIVRAREAARKFVLEQAHPRDLIAVASYSAVNGLNLVSPFTADRRQVLDALAGFGLAQSGHITDPAGFAVKPLQDLREMEEGRTTALDPESDDLTVQPRLGVTVEELFATSFSAEADDFRRYREQVVNYADQLVGLGELLQATNGRKHVILFSAGFADKALTGQSLDELSADTQRITEMGALGAATVNSETRFGSVDLRESLQDAVENFRHADVVFHAFDVGGLGNTRRDDTFATTESGKQGLSYIADATNGTAHWNMNDLGPSLGRLAEETSRYYVIAYRKMADDPSVVDIDVEILRPGAEVVAAPSRFAPPPRYTEMNDAQRQLQLAEFIVKGIEEEDVTFDARAVPFVGSERINRLAVVLEVPFEQLRRIADARRDGKAELDIMGYVLDESREMRDLFNRHISIDVDRIEETKPGLPFRYYDLLWSLPGEHRVRVLVRDLEVGMLSTRTVDVTVPAFDRAERVLMSGPVAVDFTHPGLLFRGLDLSDLPQHRIGGPVEYPFTVGGHEITPQVYTVARPGGSFHFMVVLHNIARHPITGRSQTLVEARIIDELGVESPLQDLAVTGRHHDAATGGTTMVVEVPLPEDIPPGAYVAEIDLTDAVTGETVQKVMPLLISGGQTADRD